MKLPISISNQPTIDTCGPTCLQSVYSFYNEKISLDRLQNEIRMLHSGGTLSVNLGIHALSLGYDVELFTYNLNLFDPTWFNLQSQDLIAKLKAQIKKKSHDEKLCESSEWYIKFLENGGKLKFTELTYQLIIDYLSAGKPIIAGLSSTYLYLSSREDPITTEDDDEGGYPAGHFVVISGFNEDSQEFIISDPYRQNPHSDGKESYPAKYLHVIASMLLGVFTYDANLLIASPKEPKT